MHGFPKTPEFIEAVADVIRAEDEAKKERTGKRPGTVDSECIGIFIIQKPETEKVHIPIRQSSDDYDYQTDHRNPEIENPKAQMIKAVDGTFFMVVDKTFVDWQKPEASSWKNSITEAILHHEAGHYLAGHLQANPRPPLMLDRIDEEKLHKANDPFPILAEALLSGAVFTIELEADIHAMKTIDDPMKILALHSYLASTSDTLGIRMENSNRVDRLIEIIEAVEWKNEEVIYDSTVDVYFLDDIKEE